MVNDWTDFTRERTNSVMKKSLAKIISALSLAFVMTTSSFYYIPVTAFSPEDAEQSIFELELLKEDNNSRIAELQKEIEDAKARYDEVIENEASKLEYKEALTEKIELQNQNIDYVTGQIDKIDIEIEENVDQINQIEIKIKNTDSEINENTETLKQRIRASYMTSGDNISSILAGSSSFYDMLAKFELIAKVAEHDNNLVETLQKQINELKSLKSSLQTQQEALETNLNSEKEKKGELEQALEILGQDYLDTQAELNRINGVKTEIVSTIEEREEAVAQQEEELKKIADDMEEIQYLLKQYAVSVSESVSASESYAQSVAESRAAEASRIAEESRKAEESRRAEESRKAEEAKNTQQAAGSSQAEKPVSSQAPVTEAPATPEPVIPSVETPEPEPVINSNGWAWPVGNGYGSITSDWGSRWGTYHKGVDITASDGGTIMGKPIVAACDGIVVTVQNSCPHNYGKSSSCGCGGGYGRYAVIAHTDGTYSTLYAHMSSVSVSARQFVSKGEVIGYAGSTGYSTGAHLHFEVHKSSTMDGAFWNFSNTVDPRNFI